MLPTRMHWLFLAFALVVLFNTYQFLFFLICSLVSLGLGIVLCLDTRLPDIENNYEGFRPDRAAVVEFIEIDDQFDAFVRETVSNKISIYPSKFEFNKQFSGHNGIDNQINSILELVNQDYVQSWFAQLSPANFDFNQRLYMVENYSITSLIKRFCEEDGRCQKIVNRSIEEFTKHLRIYRLTKNQMNYKLVTNDDFVAKFFENERKFEKTFSRKQICTDSTQLYQFISSLVDILLFLLMPYKSFKNETFKLLTKEIMTKLVLMPILESLSDPDFINNLIVSIFKSNTPSTETFLSILQVTDHVDTLKVLLDSVDNELLNVRSKDSEEDDTNMKNQLGSLLYLKKILQSHLTRIESLQKNNTKLAASSDKIKAKEDSRHSSISFDTVLNHNVALEYLIEYLASINCEHYLNFYLNVESFKISVEQGLLELYLDGLNDQQPQPQQSQQSNDFQFEPLKQLIYEAALNIYETYLAEEAPNKLKLVDENYCKNLKEILRNSNDTSGWMNESLFEALYFQVRDIILNHENFFPSFKRSKQFAKLIRAMDSIDEEAKSIDSGNFMADDTDSLDSSKPVQPNEKIEEKQQCDGFKINIVETGILTEHGKTYVAYLLAIEKINGNKWHTLRRYSEFATFHQMLLSKSKSHFDLKSILILPPKTVLRNRLNQTLIENRFNMLNLYVKKLNYLYEKFSFLREEIDRFIAAGHYVDPYHYQEVSQNHNQSGDNNNGNHNNIATLLNPIRSISNAVRNQSESLLDGIQKLGRTLSLQPSTQTSASQQPTMESSSFNSNNMNNALDNEDIASNTEEENIPLLTLLDEVFELKTHNFWFRRRMIELFRQIIEATYSETINRKILDYIDKWTTPEAVQDYLKTFQNSFWQNGLLLEGCASSPDEILRRKLAAKLLIVTLFSDLRKVIGNDTVERGLLNFLEVFQNNSINLRLVLLLLEIVLTETFPKNYFEQILARLYEEFDEQDKSSPSSATNLKTKLKDSNHWPPYLSTFISGI